HSKSSSGNPPSGNEPLCPTLASKLASPIRHGLTLPTTLRTASQTSASPLKNWAAPSKPPSSPPDASTFSPLRNFQSTSLRQIFLLPLPMAVPSLPPTPHRFSLFPKPS